MVRMKGLVQPQRVASRARRDQVVPGCFFIETAYNESKEGDK